MSYFRGRAPALASLSLATSANGSARTGSAQPTNVADPRFMFVLFHSEITTSSVLATFKIQATLDGTNWKDIPKPESTSSLGFATATGTGSPVNTDVCIEVPPGVAANVASIRAVCTLSGASTAAADKTSASIYWLRFGSISS